VIVTPLAMFSHLQVAITRAQVQHGMPFIRQQQVHIAPGIMAQRFCIIETAMASSLVQVIFIPPLIFSIFMVQRGIIMPGDIMPMPGMMPGMGIGIPIPGIMFMLGIIVFIIPPSLVMVAMLVSFPSSAPGAFYSSRRTWNCSPRPPRDSRFFDYFESQNLSLVVNNSIVLRLEMPSRSGWSV
jgi:hypothetical protein